jgi:hypothetical protein
MNTSARPWSIKRIRDLLARNDRAVERALVVLLNLQVSTGQLSGDTLYSNGVGFTKGDAPHMTYLAKNALLGNRLSSRDLAYLRAVVTPGRPSRIGKYAGQLLAAIEKKRQLKLGGSLMFLEKLEQCPVCESELTQGEYDSQSHLNHWKWGKIMARDLNKFYREEGWGLITDKALGIPPIDVESQAREVARWAHARILKLETLLANVKTTLEKMPGARGTAVLMLEEARIEARLPDQQDARIEELQDALRPFATAGWRIAKYGVPEPAHELQAYSKDFDCVTELFARTFEQSPQMHADDHEEFLTTEHLINAAYILKGR